MFLFKGINCDTDEGTKAVDLNWLRTRMHGMLIISEMARTEANLSLFLNPVNVGNAHRWQAHLDTLRRADESESKVRAYVRRETGHRSGGSGEGGAFCDYALRV